MEAYGKKFSHDHVAVGPRRGGSFTPDAETQWEVADALLGESPLADWAKQAQPGDRFDWSPGTFITCW